MGYYSIRAFLFFGMAFTGCQSDENNKNDTAGGDARFEDGVLPDSLRNGGYIDSSFISHSGDRLYFLHSIYSPSVLDGRSSVETCSHTQAAPLPGHNSAAGLEWNTDIYYVEWSGDVWSEPVNLGNSINSLAMECCMWLNDDETEIVYFSVSDLDGDGVDEDLGLRPTGNYRATRPDRDAEWGTPEPLPGAYGIEDQVNQYRHDIEEAPSGNLYLWESTSDGDNLLVFGERTGGTDDNPTYADPVNIEGTTNYETQVWVNDTETLLVFNHREASGETELHIRERDSDADDWGGSSTVTMTGFADSNGSNIWGEPSFDLTEDFMILTRFDTSDSDCWTPDLLYSPGDVHNGFSAPKVLN